MCALSMPETRHCCGEKSIKKRYPERASFQLFGRTAHICDEDQNTRDEKTIRNATVPPVCVDIPGNIAYPSSRTSERPPRASTRSQRAGDPRAAICTTVESWKVGRAVFTRWRCVASGWNVGAALVTTSSPRLSFRARSTHCQVLALPLTHSPEGGTLRCQITPGVPTPRLPGVCGCSCEWIQAAPCAGVTMWVAVEVAGVVATDNCSNKYKCTSRHTRMRPRRLDPLSDSRNSVAYHSSQEYQLLCLQLSIPCHAEATYVPDDVDQRHNSLARHFQ